MKISRLPEKSYTIPNVVFLVYTSEIPSTTLQISHILC